MAAKGGRIDFMFLAPLPPGRWIRYCHLPITNSVNKVCAYIIDLLLAGLLSVCCDVLQTTKCASASGNKETSIELLSRVSHAEKENSVKKSIWDHNLEHTHFWVPLKEIIAIVNQIILSQSRSFLICSQILGHVADQNYVAIRMLFNQKYTICVTHWSKKHLK